MQACYRGAAGFRCSVALVVAMTVASAADVRAKDTGTSAAEVEESSRQQIPYDKLDDDARRKVDAVLSNVSLFRRLPTQVFRCDPELFYFMTTHPDVTVNLWQVLDLSNIDVTRTGKTTFRADDGVGTVSDLQYLYTSHDTQVVYAVGTYNGPLFRTPVRGGCLLLLKTGYIREPDGNHYVTARLDAFFRIDHLGLELVTKTFQSVVHSTADKNVRQAALFLRNLSLAAEYDPEHMRRLSTKLTKVRPELREAFANIAAEAARRSKRLRVRPAGHLQ